jgi:single-strand DNA-binding protein
MEEYLMNCLNSIILEGNVVRDPVVKETPRGTTVCNFSIASNRYYKLDDDYEQETSFFEVETWAKLAEACGKGCAKGRGVRIVGRLKQDRWTGTDGKSMAKVKVVAEHVEFKPVTNKKISETDDAAESDTASLALDAGETGEADTERVEEGAGTLAAEPVPVF